MVRQGPQSHVTELLFLPFTSPTSCTSFIFLIITVKYQKKILARFVAIRNQKRKLSINLKTKIGINCKKTYEYSLIISSFNLITRLYMDTHHFIFRYLQQRKHYRIGHTPPYLCVFTAERDFRIARERGNIWGRGI